MGAAMRDPKRKELNSLRLYGSRYRRYGLRSIDEPQTGSSPRKWSKVKEVLIHAGLFIAGLITGTVAGLIVLGLVERWLSNGG
jgi:hypothetical protein